MRNSKTSEYTKVIGITPKDMEYIDQTRSKKSKAGKLAEMISFYKANNK